MANPDKPIYLHEKEKINTNSNSCQLEGWMTAYMSPSFWKGLFTWLVCGHLYYLLTLKSTKSNTKTMDSSLLICLSHISCYKNRLKMKKKLVWPSQNKCLIIVMQVLGINPKKLATESCREQYRSTGAIFTIRSKPAVQLKL